MLSSPFNRRKSTLWAALLMVVTLNLCVYGQTAHFAFLNFDDPQYITSNPHVHEGFSVQGLQWAFTSTRSRHWHPLTWLSHMFDCQLFGLRPAGHHLVNLLLHTANSILLGLLLLRATGNPANSFWVAAFFAVHPLHVESVAWVSDRKDLLAGFFWLCALLLYLRYVNHRKRRYFLYLTVLFSLALLSKPVALSLPFILLLCDWWPLRRFAGSPPRPDDAAADGSRPPDRLAGALWEKLLLLALAALAGLAAFGALKGGVVIPSYLLPSASQVANAMIAAIEYIIKTIWPFGLSPYYPYWADRSPVLTAAAAAVLLGISYFTLRLRSEWPFLAFGWFWYLICLAPSGGLIGLGPHRMADRYTYLALAGLLVGVVWAVAELAARQRRVRLTATIVAGTLLVLLSARSAQQTAHWENSVTLFEHALRVDARNAVARNNLAAALLRQGQNLSAAAHLRKALTFNPALAEAHFNLANIYLRQGRLADAEDHYRTALSIRPGYARAHNNLGLLLLARNATRLALAHFEAALENDPAYAAAQKNRELSLNKLNSSPEK